MFVDVSDTMICVFCGSCYWVWRAVCYGLLQRLRALGVRHTAWEVCSACTLRRVAR